MVTEFNNTTFRILIQSLEITPKVCFTHKVVKHTQPLTMEALLFGLISITVNGKL